jgi:hypothetical protein
MALAFKVGDVVNENKFVIKNATVIGACIVDGSTDVHYKISYLNQAGQSQEGYIEEDKMILV